MKLTQKFMNAKSKLSKWLDNLGKAKIVYIDSNGKVQEDKQFVSLEDAKGVVETLGGTLVSYNGKTVK
jgi:hypothetical protein